MTPINHEGERFGRLLVLGQTEKRMRGQLVWKCRCDCGKEVEATGYALRSGGHSYENFLSDMGRRPDEFHSLDRINNMRGYKPSNCRWATWQEQNRNRRPNGEGYKARLKRLPH